MSFLFAEKYQIPNCNYEFIQILCDTKVTPDRYTQANFSEEERSLISKYGFVKSTIICPELCISFAGNNTVFATNLFRQLKEMKSFEPDDVSKYALSIHLSAPNFDNIEFIISYFSNSQIHIDCIKNGKVYKDVPVAHIGSEIAFEDFQKKCLSYGENTTNPTKTAFSNVISGCRDETVGGVAIGVMYDYALNSFVYMQESGFFSSKEQIVKLGENIQFYLSASDGGYSYHVQNIDIENVLFSIEQMKPSILYSRRFRVDSTNLNNPNQFGLMMPMEIINGDGTFMRYR